ncbi:probable helicase MAGATAMA 3 isoform X7 [Prunus dulcis]|uniref:probable helicase MAGATAMA 3 isoform X7 n=1 Tax=Prunus dulcis TaxID=3755 RepID=UPI001483ACB8|nr:probable helicase MAGATAMA 3 isoform X7 [Prunus dulcis]
MAVDKDKLQEAAPIARFHKIVLGWDYYGLLTELTKNEKKNKKKNKGEIDDGLGMGKVKDTYKDVDDYISTYEPLLFEEVKAQIIQSKDENQLLNPKRNLVVACTEVDGFHLATLTYEKSDMDDKEAISQNDLLLLLKPNHQDKEELPTVYAFALVESRQASSFRIRMYLAGEAKNLKTDAVETCPRLLNIKSLVTSSIEGERFFVTRKICSLSTIAREYVALWSIGSLPFKDIILGAAEKNIDSEGQAWKISRPLEEFIKDNLNESQQNAIQAGLSRKPFILIQQWVTNHKASAKVNCSGEKPEVVNSSRKYRVRVLVCAPSNSALDEIVLRVLNSGVRDESDRSYNPKIVRIGLKAHHSVQAVSMDDMVERKKGSMGGSKDRDGGADRFRAEILEEAVIVFSTLSFSGSPLFSKYNRGFDVVIIDEAAQAVEPAILVPLTNGCKQVFLIGDPVQLPATVISPIAAKFGYGMSLFERFQRAGYPVTMLKMQYRMHPEIRSFPSREFYSESLEDGPNIKEQTKRSWHDYRCFGPFCFFDLHEAKESEDSGSKSNDAEVEFVMLLYNKLVSKYPELKSSHQFAIISPYAAQVNLLKERFKSTFGVQSEKVVDITTVDGCQGREKDVAIFSCVRASEKGAIGFLADFRRMNVGITRAKSSILVVGSASTLRKGDKHWNNLVESAEKRDSVFKVSKPYASFFSDENLESMAIKKESSMEEVQNDELDNDPGSYNFGDADQAQGDDNDYGDGDGEADMGDGGDD